MLAMICACWAARAVGQTDDIVTPCEPGTETNTRGECVECPMCPVGEMLTVSTVAGCDCQHVESAFFDVSVLTHADAQDCTRAHVPVADVEVVQDPPRDYVIRWEYEHAGTPVVPAPFNFVDGVLGVATGGLMHVRSPAEGTLTAVVFDRFSALEVLRRDFPVSAVCEAAESSDESVTLAAEAELTGLSEELFDDTTRQELYADAISAELGLNAGDATVWDYTEVDNGLMVRFNITVPRPADQPSLSIEATLDVERVANHTNEPLAAGALARLLSRASNYCCHALLTDERAAAPSFSVSGGNHASGPLSITVRTPTDGGVVRVTVDGTNPLSSLSAQTSGVQHHTTSLPAGQTSVVRAVTTHPTLSTSVLVERTYVVG